MPGHDIAARTMWLVDGADDYGTDVNRFGHLVSFEVKGGAEAARKVFDGFEMIWRATDLHLESQQQVTRNALYAVAFAPDRGLVAVAGEDGRVFLIDKGDSR